MTAYIVLFLLCVVVWTLGYRHGYRQGRINARTELGHISYKPFIRFKNLGNVPGKIPKTQ